MVTGADRDNLTGVWHGQYSYPAPQVKPVGFVATLIDFAGSLSGSTHEETAIGPGPAQLFAVLEGRRTGTEVMFVKTYDPAVEDWQDILYEGTLNSDATEISGTWVIPGVWAGPFLMIREQGKAVAKRQRASVKA